MRGLHRHREQNIEELLRERRPEPSADLLTGIVRRFERRSGRRLSFNSAPGRIAALSAGLLLGLLAVGGLGYAAATFAHNVGDFGFDHNGFFGHQAPRTVVNPALDQYGTTATTTAPAAPANTIAPTISGDTTVGSTLTANAGTWSGSPSPTFTYQWESCDANAANCFNATAATTSNTYTLGSGDVGRRFEVVVTATNSAGSSSATSGATAQVTAAAGSVSTTTTTTTTVSTSTDTTSGEIAATTPPNSSGTVTATAPGESQGATITWSPTTFGNTPVVVKADPTPTIASGFAIQGDTSKNTVVSITVTDKNGVAIHTLATPLEIVINDPGVAGYVPQVSDDNGKTWRALGACAGNAIPSGGKDCYFASGGKFHILTLHLTLFAVISKVNADVSETGKPLQPANSHKWGDRAFVHPGKPHAHVTTEATLVGDHGVKFGLFVDEQVAAYVQIFLHGKALPIIGAQSTWRGHKLTGKNGTQIHIPVLHIGTINAQFTAAGLVRGARVKITMIDYDGHTITRTLIVK